MVHGGAFNISLVKTGVALLPSAKQVQTRLHEGIIPDREGWGIAEVDQTEYNLHNVRWVKCGRLYLLKLFSNWRLPSMNEKHSGYGRHAIPQNNSSAQNGSI